MGGGVGLLDYDGDGWLDVYAVQGGPFPPEAGPRPERGPPLPQPGRRHLRGRDRALGDRCHARRIRPRRRRRRLRQRRPSRPVRHALAVLRPLRNRGDGTFEDATAAVGLGGDRDWPTSAAFADLDNDGDLDLYVCHYLALGRRAPHALPLSTRARSRSTTASRKDLPAAARPRLPQRRRPVRRRDAEAGHRRPRRPRAGRGRGRPRRRRPVDLFVANDMTANYLFPQPGRPAVRGDGARRGRGRQCRAEAFRPAWASPAATSTATAGPTWPSPTSTASRPRSSATWAAACSPTRRPPSAWPRPAGTCLGFGIAFLDVNNDGRLDLATANGHVNDYRPDLPYAMPAQLMARHGRTPDRRLASRRSPLGQSPGSAGGWPPATSTTTAGSISLARPPERAAGLLPQSHRGSGGFVIFRLEGTASEPRRRRRPRHGPGRRVPARR